MGSTDRFLAKVRSIAEKYLKSGSVSVIFHTLNEVNCRYLPIFFKIVTRDRGLLVQPSLKFESRTRRRCITFGREFDKC